VNGLAEPSEGTVAVDGLEVAEHGAEVRRRVAFAFTDPAAQLVMPTAAEDVALSLRRTHRKKDERRDAAVDVLRRFGLEELADRSVHTLSGGQRQLLALAGVLATDPSILVADEPTTLLDLANTRLIGDLLFDLEQQLLLVTHDLDLATRCDRALVLDDARVVFDGDPEQAVAFYRSLV
jgi:biotin transport system ATP-binding protein